MTDHPVAATFAAPRALAALRDGRGGVVELVFSRGMYVRFGADWVGLADPGAEFGPLSVAVRGLPDLLSGTVAGAPARVAGRRLILGGGAVSLERVRERRCGAVVRSMPLGGPAACIAAGRAALVTLGEPPGRLRGGIEQLASGVVASGVRALAGFGDGLTPAGDDVLAGYAAWGGAADGRSGRVSELASGRSSPLGLAYLRAAEHGELPDAGAALMTALRGGTPQESAAAARGLRSWGASSGAALGWGLVAGTPAGFGAYSGDHRDPWRLRWRPCAGSPR